MSDHYLFIDGAYLRTIYREAMQKFCGVEGDLDPARVRYGGSASRAFFYDSLDDERRLGESDADFQSRVAAQEAFFNEIRAVNGFHVRLGSVTGKKRRRQKEVDVLLAVDMLTHGLTGNMKKGILLAGDLDFRPIVEALVQRGVFVDVWFEGRSAAKDLYGAADFGRPIPFSELHGLSRESVLKSYPLPRRSAGNAAPHGPTIKRGRVGSSPASLFQFVNDYEFWVQDYRGNSLLVRDTDVARIERFMELEFEPVVWDP
jgi:NYN domain